jgi:hypothetical protein
MATHDEGIILDPTKDVFECYADADFCGLWDRSTATEDPSTAKSRIGFLISFAKCPLVWASKLQTEFCLSTTESEYVSLSTALRQVIPLMGLLREMKEHGVINKLYCPKVFCKAFEDSSGALVLARAPCMRPQTQHMNVKYHHFR